MILRRSTFIHLLAINEVSTLAVHAITQLRVPLTAEIAQLIGWFDTAVALEAVLPQLAAALQYDQTTLRACVRMLLGRGILTEQTASEEHAAIARELSAVHGRDPEAALDRIRRANAEGSHPYWTVQAPHAIEEALPFSRRLDVLLFGDCDVQMETDFLRREAARRGIDLRAAASFPSDIALAGERKHDAIIVGALQARHAIVLGDATHHGGDRSQVYLDAVRALVTKLRALTDAPILIDGLPEPTVQPNGFADRGFDSHRNRFRRTNLALAGLAEELADVYVVDVAAALAATGAAALIDDGLVGYTHFGSPGWMLQRPASELAAVHHQFPDLTPLATAVGGKPYRREAVVAGAHMDALTAVLAIDQKKCVIVDLDGVLWPGVLAETGSPFAWAPDVSGPNSYVGLYFGIHEALRTLRQRGVLLACVSKNDEAAVRALWRYPDHYPRHRLLTPDSFVTWRVNWADKADNIRSIADELGFSLDAFMFIDDTARERERVQQSIPQVTVLGADLFALRRTLLSDPRLQPLRVTAEQADRTNLVRAQLNRTRLQEAAADGDAFIASLEIVSTVERVTPGADVLDRVCELFERTTQFNATGRKFNIREMQRLIGRSDGRLFVLHMRDRLADHGLVGAAVLVGGEILNVAMSCRVIGLGGERALLEAVTKDQAGGLRGRIIASERNIPVRHLYAGHGFTDQGDGWWVTAEASSRALV